MRREKCFIVEHRQDGSTTTVTSFRPYHTEVSDAKVRILEAANSGEPLTLSVVEHVNSKTFSTDGNGTVKVRGSALV